MTYPSHPDWRDALLQRTGATGIGRITQVQRLWKGHGQILRVSLSGGTVASVIVKKIAPIVAGQDLGLQRKQHSYKVERAWYAHYSHLNGPDCRLPRCLAQGSTASGDWLILEDLDAAGYPQRRRQPDTAETEAVLKWLACFHAHWLGTRAPALWAEGSYWHLATRPAEWQALPAVPLKAHKSATRRLTVIGSGDCCSGKGIGFATLLSQRLPRLYHPDFASYTLHTWPA